MDDTQNFTLEFGEAPAPESAEESNGAVAVKASGTSVETTAAIAHQIQENAGLESDLTQDELAQVNDFVDKIDISNSQAVLNYGTGTQKKIADFSERALENVRSKDMGEVGSMITSLVTELKQMDEPEDKGILGFFKKKTTALERMKLKYSKMETNVESVKSELEKRQVQLMKDSAMLDRMYDMNLRYFKELSMYILAGKKKLEQVKTFDLPEAQRKAAETGRPEDAQTAKDLSEQIERFEKKLHDLELTRTIAMQTAPQIRMVQASDNVMAEKIQTTIVNTIPLWKNQMVIAIGIEDSLQATKAQRAVTDTTNELLRKNAAALKQATVETARESERSIVDIETLRNTNEQLISTLDEVMNIQQQGREKRMAAQAELTAIENQLKEKLLQASQQK